MVDYFKNIRMPDGNIVTIDDRDYLKDNQITNCILNIPQNINLTISDGTLTLNQGSTVYIPDGFESDGVTPKFLEKVVSSNATSVQNRIGQTFAFTTFNASGAGALYTYPINNVRSGTDYSGFTGMFYDTSTNKISLVNNGTIQSSGYSLPVGIATATSINDPNFNEIDQVFNGMGHAGNIFFILPKLKGLFPWGRNNDGTLNNIEYTVPKVILYAIPNGATQRNYSLVMDNNNGVGQATYIQLDFIPNERYNDDNVWILYTRENKVYQWSTTENKYLPKVNTIIKLGDIDTENGIITRFEPNYSYRATDYNEFNELKDNILSTSNATNCILKSSKDFNLELVDGTVVLKAGGFMYVPNGKINNVNVFIKRSFETDTSLLSTTFPNGKYFIFSISSGIALDTILIASGSNYPSSPAVGTKFYNTNDNLFYRYSGTEWQKNGYSLPLGIITLTNNQVTSIDKVFNDIGYFGKSLFVNPGLEALIPFGINADGTRNNFKLRYNNPIISTRTDNLNGTYNLALAPTAIFAYSGEYDIVSNYNKIPATGVTSISALIGNVTHTNGNVTDISVNSSFLATDYNEFNELKDNTLNKTQITNCILEAPNGVATYSGSTITIKSGLKVLTPNGRNADGTLNNVEYTISSDKVLAMGTTEGKYYSIIFASGNLSNCYYTYYYEQDTEPKIVLGVTQFWLNTQSNVGYYRTGQESTWTIKQFVRLLEYENIEGNITNFKLYQPLRAVDYNDFHELKDNTVTLNDNQTITGIKTLTNNLYVEKSGYAGIEYKNPTVDYANLQANQYGARIISRDKNGQYFASIENTTDSSNNLVNRFVLRRQVGGADKITTLNLIIDSNGIAYATAPTYTSNYADNSTKIVTTAYMANHWCTTAPTTASTASNARPAVVIQNYVNGTSGYRVWSDGYCEQWGEFVVPQLQSKVTQQVSVTLLKNYKNTNYNVITHPVTDNGNSWGLRNYSIKKTVSTISLGMLSNGYNLESTGNWLWKTSGYIK